jgi:cell division protein FtsI/penicillin-binding protein 2
MDSSLNYRRLWLIAWGFGALLAAIAGRLVYIQAIAPVEPMYQSEGTERRIVRPARRGTILDANRAPLVVSDLMVTVRADPLKLGMFAREVADLIAPVLELPPAVVAERLRPSYYPSRESVLVTNQGVITTNLVTVQRLRRNNGVFTNLPYSKWEELETRIEKSRFAEEIQLLTTRSNLDSAFKLQRKQLGWWNVPGLLGAKRARVADVKKIAPRWQYVRTNAVECRANGLYPEFVEVRVYPNAHVAAHLLGFTTNSTDSVPNRVAVKHLGAQGLEQRFDDELQGSHGLLITHQYGSTELVPLRTRDVPALDGLNVRTTIDLSIQSYVEEALDEAVLRLKPKSISAVVIRPSTGDILALANRPTYDPNTRRIPSLDAMLNRAVKVPAEPGSTFKVVTYAAAFNEGVIRLSEMIDCEHGRWNVPGTRRWINDDQGHAMDSVTIEEAFAKSSNVGAVKVGLRMNTNTFVRYIRDFGFGSRTGIECGEFSAFTNLVRGQPHIRRLYGEPSGGIPRWDGLTSSSLPFGYGLYVTPLQTAMAVAAIANDGVLMHPRLVTALEKADGEVVSRFPATPARRVVSSETAKTMRRVMQTAVEDGTGGQAALEEYTSGGKTGTAKKVVNRAYSSTHYYASFVGFLPADEPELVIMVNADEPTTQGRSYYGGKACAPVFNRIATAAASYLALRPSFVTTNGVVMDLSSNRPPHRD